MRKNVRRTKLVELFRLKSAGIAVTAHGRNFLNWKIPYSAVVVVDFADLECEASAKSVTVL